MLLVDAYNVLHTTGVLPPELAGPEVPDLVRLIAHSRYADREVTLVCDGVGTKDRGVKFGDARVLFSGKHHEADDLIERLIARYAKGRSLTVVSSDRRLHRAARKHRAEGMASADFLRHLAEDHRRVKVRDRTGGWAPRAAVPLDPYSVRQWMTEFGYEPVEDEPTPKAKESDPAAGRLERARAKAKRDVESKTRAKPGAKPGAASAFGERLGLPAVPEATPEKPKAPEPVVPDQAESAPPSVIEIDDELRAALEEWRDIVRLDDLDMTRWIDDVRPL